MSRIISFDVPVPISVNHCYFTARNGMRIKTKKSKDYDKEVISIVKNIKYKFPDKTKIVCELKFYFKDNRRRDTHNTLKLLLDAIEEGGLYEDDMYVLPRVLDFDVDRDNPRVELKFYIMGVNNAE